MRIKIKVFYAFINSANQNKLPLKRDGTRMDIYSHILFSSQSVHTVPIHEEVCSDSELDCGKIKHNKRFFFFFFPVEGLLPLKDFIKLLNPLYDLHR